MGKTVKEEGILFYFNICFLCDKKAQKYLKVLSVHGELACLSCLVINEDKPEIRELVSDTLCMPETSAGTHDRIFENRMYCMVYNTDLEYFHLLGRKTVERAYCVNCGNLRDTFDLKYDHSVSGCICRQCTDAEYYGKL
jgi:hypothetical protein